MSNIKSYLGLSVQTSLNLNELLNPLSIFLGEHHRVIAR